MNNRIKSGGFSLVEVLVSMAIAGTLVLLVCQIALISTRNDKKASTSIDFTTLANSVMAIIFSFQKNACTTNSLISVPPGSLYSSGAVTAATPADWAPFPPSIISPANSQLSPSQFSSLPLALRSAQSFPLTVTGADGKTVISSGGTVLNDYIYQLEAKTIKSDCSTNVNKVCVTELTLHSYSKYSVAALGTAGAAMKANATLGGGIYQQKIGAFRFKYDPGSAGPPSTPPTVNECGPGTTPAASCVHIRFPVASAPTIISPRCDPGYVVNKIEVIIEGNGTFVTDPTAPIPTTGTEYYPYGFYCCPQVPQPN
jgi:prepilin-type N-terminal cleavage/methylation domain-containing protein